MQREPSTPAPPSRATYAARVEGLLSRMLGAGAACASCVPGAASPAALHPLERAGVTRPVARRLLELAAGRAAARAALARLGVEGAVIPRAPDGAPVWPEGWVGSIAHTDSLAVAAVASVSLFASLGVDLEPDAPLEPGLWPSIATAAELRRLRGMAPATAGEHARTLFCAKEAAYKCQYPMTGLLLDFGDLEIQPVEGETPLTRDSEFAWRTPHSARSAPTRRRIQRADGPCPSSLRCSVREFAGRTPHSASSAPTRRRIQRADGPCPSSLRCSVREFRAILQRDAAPLRRGDGLSGGVGRAGGYVVALSAAPRRSAP